MSKPPADSLPGWIARPRPAPVILDGRFCRLEPLTLVRHGDDLVAAFGATDPASWTYLFVGPFAEEAALRHWLADIAAAGDPLFSAIIDRASGRACGLCALMRPDPANGVIEIGSIHYADAIKRGPVATEAMYLMMAHVFGRLGYRRYEWKCDARNAPSRRAAERLGFTFEGIFRQHMVVKGENRDTAWFSLTDCEWRRLKRAYEAWLAPDNFDTAGRQRRKLSDLIAAAR